MTTYTDWICTYHAIVEAGDIEAAGAAIAAVTGQSADTKTFVVPLSLDGQPMATHYGTLSLATAEIVTALSVALANGSFPPSLVYFLMGTEDNHDAGTQMGVLINTNSASAVDKIGQYWGTLFDWAATLADQGLQVIGGV